MDADTGRVFKLPKGAVQTLAKTIARSPRRTRIGVQTEGKIHVIEVLGTLDDAKIEGLSIHMIFINDLPEKEA